MTTTNNEMETDSTIYKALLESTKAIPWKIDWATLKFPILAHRLSNCSAGRAQAG